MAGDVVLGYDGSAGSEAALAVSVRVARAFGVQLAIVFGYGANPLGGETQDFEHRLKEVGGGRVAAALEAVRRLDADLVVEPLVVEMRPVEALIAAAEQRDALAIVVGSSGEGPIVGTILGSVPYKLLHRSRIPVVVVPAGA
jgi:nucleotide-binding universal stress UspA family protein